jgi:hypothetical protein
VQVTDFVSQWKTAFCGDERGEIQEGFIPRFPNFKSKGTLNGLVKWIRKAVQNLEGNLWDIQQIVWHIA